MPKPADLAVLGLRPHDYLTVTRSLSTFAAAAARNEVLGRVDAHLTEVSLAFPTTLTVLRSRDWEAEFRLDEHVCTTCSMVARGSSMES